MSHGKRKRGRPRNKKHGNLASTQIQALKNHHNRGRKQTVRSSKHTNSTASLETQELNDVSISFDSYSCVTLHTGVSLTTKSSERYKLRSNSVQNTTATDISNEILNPVRLNELWREAQQKRLLTKHTQQLHPNLSADSQPYIQLHCGFFNYSDYQKVGRYSILYCSICGPHKVQGILLQQLSQPNVKVSINQRWKEVNQLDLAYAINCSELSFKHAGLNKFQCGLRLPLTSKRQFLKFVSPPVSPQDCKTRVFYTQS